MSEKNENILDDLDISIVEYLVLDGRISFNDIAKELGVSHGTIHNRFNKMREFNNLRVGCFILPNYVGLESVGHIHMLVEADKLEEVAAKVAAFPEMGWVAKITGPYNLVADFTCFDNDHLEDLLSNRLQKMEGIKQIDVAMYLKYYKSEMAPDIRALRQSHKKIR